MPRVVRGAGGGGPRSLLGCSPPPARGLTAHPPLDAVFAFRLFHLKVEIFRLICKNSEVGLSRVKWGNATFHRAGAP